MEQATEVYSSYGQWKNQQVFQLPAGYQKNVRMMSYEFLSPSGDCFRICIFNAVSDASVYGESGSAEIETLKLDKFEEVISVRDGGVNTIYTWREIEEIRTIHPEKFGSQTRPKNNMLDWASESDAEVLSWQSFTISSETMSVDELLEILKSINL